MSSAKFATLNYDILEILADSSASKKYTRRQICEKLEKMSDRDYTGINYKTVLEHVDTLKENGSIIDDGGLYKATQLSRAQAHLLSDTIKCSKFIPTNEALELVKKIYDLSGTRYVDATERVKLQKQFHIENEEFLATIETILTAIDSNCKIQFDYHKLLESQKLSAKSNPHVFNPYLLVMKNQHYYVVGYDEKYEKMIALRVIRIKGCKIYEKLDEDGNKVVPARVNEKSVPGYTKSGIDVEKITANPYMYMSEAESFVIKIEEGSISDVIDWFGNIAISRKISAGEGYVLFKVKASREAMKYWALQYVDVAEVVEPPSFRKEILAELKKGEKKYK